MNISSLLVLGMVIGIIVWLLWRKHRKRLTRWWQRKEESLPRQWHPKSEKACLDCQAGVQASLARVNQAVSPYRSQKQKQGAPKQLSTEG